MKRFLSFSTILFVFIFTSYSDTYATDQVRDRIEVKREAVTTAAQERRSNIDQIRAETQNKVEERREEFLIKLASIRDENKREIVERVSQKISLMNENWTDRWTRSLMRLSELIVKIEERVANNDLRDASETQGLIQNAKSSIDDAQSAVDKQAANSYVIEITDEENLRADVNQTMNQFKEDLRSVHALVKNAHQAVRLIIKSLK